MTQEEKQLLLVDLSARLPYGVKIQCEDYLFTFDKEHMGIGLLYTDFNRNPLESPKIILSGCYYGEDIKPYLFPLSSMTNEQLEELGIERDKDILLLAQGLRKIGEGDKSLKGKLIAYNAIDWLNAHHFD